MASFTTGCIADRNDLDFDPTSNGGYRYVHNSPTNYTDPSGLDPPPHDPGLIIRVGDPRYDPQPCPYGFDDRPLQPTWSPFDFLAGWAGGFLAKPAVLPPGPTILKFPEPLPTGFHRVGDKIIGPIEVEVETYPRIYNPD